jgi:hypothetical protein
MEKFVKICKITKWGRKKREKKHWQNIKAMELNSFFSFFPCSMFLFGDARFRV